MQNDAKLYYCMTNVGDNFTQVCVCVGGGNNLTNFEDEWHMKE